MNNWRIVWSETTDDRKPRVYFYKKIMNNPKINVEFPSGACKEVYPIRVLVQAQDAEFFVKTGMHLPGIAKQHPSVKRIREEYEMPKEIRTWAQLAPLLRDFYNLLTEVIQNGQF